MASPRSIFQPFFASWPETGSGCGLSARGRVVEPDRCALRFAPTPSFISPILYAEPATFTPKRLATRGTGQAATQRAAEHGSITPYPTTPVALDRCRVFFRFLPLRFESD